jgi:hypothetical protein
MGTFKFQLCTDNVPPYQEKSGYNKAAVNAAINCQQPTTIEVI